MTATLCTLAATALLTGGPLPQPNVPVKFSDWYDARDLVEREPLAINRLFEQAPRTSDDDVGRFSSELRRLFPGIDLSPVSPTNDASGDEADVGKILEPRGLEDRSQLLPSDPPESDRRTILTRRIFRMKEQLAAQQAQLNSRRSSSGIAPGEVYPTRVFYCDGSGRVESRVIDVCGSIVPIPPSPR